MHLSLCAIDHVIMEHTTVKFGKVKLYLVIKSLYNEVYHMRIKPMVKWIVGSAKLPEEEGKR